MSYYQRLIGCNGSGEQLLSTQINTIRTLTSAQYSKAFSYDAAGDLLCRAPTSATTCSGTATGSPLTFDNEGRLVTWQNTPTNPNSTDTFLYDGEGRRVEQRVTSGATTTTTVYVGSLEEVSTTGASTTTTTYYYAGGARIALAVNGTLSYLASDILRSATAAFDANGNATASQLYGPYGNTRYRSGAMPTSYGFTGQRADAAMGLDYYQSRYYDPVLGQFASTDLVLDGLNSYGYVYGNPTTIIDPTGEDGWDDPSWWWNLIASTVALGSHLISGLTNRPDWQDPVNYQSGSNVEQGPETASQYRPDYPKNPFEALVRMLSQRDDTDLTDGLDNTSNPIPPGKEGAAPGPSGSQYRKNASRRKFERASEVNGKKTNPEKQKRAKELKQQQNAQTQQLARWQAHHEFDLERMNAFQDSLQNAPVSPVSQPAPDNQNPLWFLTPQCACGVPSGSPSTEPSTEPSPEDPWEPSFWDIPGIIFG